MFFVIEKKHKIVRILFFLPIHILTENFSVSTKDRRKCIQHFIQYLIFLLDETLEGISDVGWNLIFSLAHFHAICFIQHSKLRSSKVYSFNNSKWRTQPHLHCLHKLMDSDDGKPHRGKTRKWVKRRSERGALQQHHKRAEDIRSGRIWRNVQNRYDGFWVYIGSNFTPTKTWWDKFNWIRWETCTDSTLFGDRWIFPIFELSIQNLAECSIICCQRLL